MLAAVTYYRRPLALAHDLGFGFHAELCAPGILELLEPVRMRGGLVVELGCGSGALTRHLLEAGHRVLATDASPAMLDLARENLPGAEVERLVLPDDPIPEADAIVSVGHVLNYLPDERALSTALVAVATALRPRGLLALDLCDLEYGQVRRDERPAGWADENWALVTEFSSPTPARFVRQMAIFTRSPDGSWQRDDERHENVLIDTSLVPLVLAEGHVEAAVRRSFGREQLPTGLRAVMGHKRRR